MKEITVTKKYTVYTYDELDENAKNKVREWYLDGQEQFIFDEIIDDEIKNLFPYSDLKYQYDISCCQGSGFNIYGKIDPYDIFSKMDLTEKEKNTIKFYDFYYTFEIPYNHYYTYCMSEHANNYIECIAALEAYNISGINKALIKKVCDFIESYIAELCSRLYDTGYSYFYEISDSDLSCECSNMNYIFLKDGTFFNEI